MVYLFGVWVGVLYFLSLKYLFKNCLVIFFYLYVYFVMSFMVWNIWVYDELFYVIFDIFFVEVLIKIGGFDCICCIVML